MTSPLVERIEARLNPDQLEAVKATEGPVLIIAGAGSGKTRVLTYRIAWLIRALGVSPEEIVAVTFTNKAAGEMKERIVDLLDGDPGGIRMGTFHSLCLRILRSEAGRLGYKPGFLVFDTADQTAVMKEVVEELNLDTERFPARQLLHRISAVRNRNVTPDEIEAQLGARAGHVTLAQVHEVYARRLRDAGAMDFDDLILRTLQLFREHPEVEARLRERTRYVLVDEYQDTNRSQYVLVNALAAGTRNLCVVGDDAQSIYRFRGADIGNILRFTEDYSDARTIKLTRNYRSTGRILKAAGSVIVRNKAGIQKELWTENPQGERIAWLQAETDRDEAAFVVDQIRALGQGAGGIDLPDIAVLYRTNAQSRLIEEALVKAGLPYRIYGSTRFYERREIKDLMAYLRLAMNPSDNVSLKRVLNVPPRGIGKVTLAALEEAARAEGISLHASVEKAAADPASSRSTRALKGLVDLLADLRRRAEGGEPASALIKDLVTRLEYTDHLRKSEPGDVESRIENIEQLVAAAQEKEAAAGADLQDFLDGAALVSEVESVQGDTGVSLMTLHCAKGLEFRAVFMVGMEENLFPHVRSMESPEPEELEEERRLCYVGMTRARERLVMSCARQRRGFGDWVHNEPSRFVGEIGSGLLHDLTPDWVASSGSGRPGEGTWDGPAWSRTWNGGGGAGAARRPARSDSREPVALGDEDISVPSDDEGEAGSTLTVGMKVYHLKFGYGEVEHIEGSGEKQKATVRFSAWGRMKLMTRFAKLQVSR
ncbi:MAG TPA: UvrD-helicase domain-containing protein [Candidatus Polarisedimenticolia bacterium]|jgi:DNA helicase-2/ATP-dependent DNA helicase PcrA